MTVQGLLQEGTKECSMLEKIADAILAFPRALWKGRTITVVEKGAECVIKDKETNSLASWVKSGWEESGRNISVALMSLIGSIVLVAGSIIAAPFLAVGLACKKIALLKNPGANDYHELIEAASSEAPLKYEKEILAARKRYVDKQIQEIDKQLGSLKAPPEATQAVKKLITDQRASLESRKESLVKYSDQLAEEIKTTEKEWKPLHDKVVVIFAKFKSSNPSPQQP